MLITLRNPQLTVVINTLGAELQSLLDRQGNERLWKGNPAIWKGQAPVLFPITGGLKGDRYFLHGKEYIQQKHGFARFEEFIVEKYCNTSASFLLMANERTRTGFPFEFALHISYTLEDNHLIIEYRVENQSQEVMYFSIGAHEGYACPGGIEDYAVVFDKPETIASYVLDGNLLCYETRPILKNETVLPLKYDYFAVDALVFLDLQSRGVTLIGKKNNCKLRVNFKDFPYLLLWTKPGAPYLCIEPWHGIHDFIDHDQDITHKRGIIALENGKEFSCTHTISPL
ncbi:MAG TPA: aldose 1-epimerase family protein [Bacillota bacterium]